MIVVGLNRQRDRQTDIQRKTVQNWKQRKEKEDDDKGKISMYLFVKNNFGSESFILIGGLRRFEGK